MIEYNMLWKFNSDLIISSEMDSPLQFSQCFPLQWMGQRHSPSAQIPPFLQGFGLHVSGTAKRFDHLWYVLANSLQEYWCRRIISINTEITRINNFAISAINQEHACFRLNSGSSSPWMIPWLIVPPILTIFQAILGECAHIVASAPIAASRHATSNSPTHFASLGKN